METRRSGHAERLVNDLLGHFGNCPYVLLAFSAVALELNESAGYPVSTVSGVLDWTVIDPPPEVRTAWALS